ncbi:MAG: protein kinase [Chloroflexi bacterium]|nr:protein kinase [Chloroflexota bacterium]
MSPTSLEGQVIGKYRVLEALGRGGMAQVYRAYHPQLDRHVALKVLRSDLVEDQEFLARFQREARAVAALRHHNIVQVFDFDAQDDVYYMVMELLEGDSLRARLNKYRVAGQRMPLPEILRILQDVLHGLGYAHSQGLIHRDIKPANIMLTSRDEAVLTDFGIAQIVGGAQYTASGALMGTLSYMAPEQGLRGQCDQRSDLYSLGIVLYEMLTGYTPFDADTPLAILMKHLNDPLPLPRQIDPALPEALEQIVIKVLAKEPADRYQNAEELSDALEQITPESLPGGPRKVIPAPTGFDSQAVFSGTSRQKLSDRRFSREDTDPDLARSLQPAALQTLTGRPLNTANAVLGGLGAALVINLAASMAATLTGLNVYHFGWAFEIFLLSGLLALIMWSVQKHWLLIPIIIVFGNAAILAYCAITGRWGDWAFLWLLDVLIIGAAIVLPIRLKQAHVDTRAVARTGGALFAALSVLLAAITCILSLLAALSR